MPFARDQPIRPSVGAPPGETIPWSCRVQDARYRSASRGTPDRLSTDTGCPAVVEATVIFRWFNLIGTGERVKDLLLTGWDSAEARRRLTGVTPLVTGAYQIKNNNRMTKLTSGIRTMTKWRCAI